jgi:hypothetical protein
MEINDLLRCALQVLGQAAVPVDRVREVVGNGKKQVKAFNLCDGNLNQSEIAKKCKMDPGNLSRTFARWKENGILFVLGEGRAATFLHIYPLPPEKKKGRAA